jgi:hypothetical protein
MDESSKCVCSKRDALQTYFPDLSIRTVGTYNELYLATEHNSNYAFGADNIRAPKARMVARRLRCYAGCPRSCQGTPEFAIATKSTVELPAGPRGTKYGLPMSEDTSAGYQQANRIPSYFSRNRRGKYIRSATR